MAEKQQSDSDSGGAEGPARPAGSTPVRYQPVYAIFEGGGAKGITHVGALKAMEEERFALVGVAGTSAGAIIAALAAVGYKADELLDPDQSTDILTTLGVTPLGVLGRRRWIALGLLRDLAKPIATFVVLALIGLAVGIGFGLDGVTEVAFVVFAVSVGAAVLLVAAPLWRRGMFSPAKLTETLNSALKAKLEQHHQDLGTGVKVPERIRFSDIDPTVMPRCSPLKIIVSDVRSGRLVLFDSETPCVAVADAIAASAAIPFAFTPPPIEGARTDGKPVYADGGLVSNLPAWSFAVEKRALERQQGGQPIPILAFSLVETSTVAGFAAGADRRGLSLLSYVGRVLLTGIFGSQHVVEEFITDLHQIELETPLGTLGFDLSREQANAAHASGLRSAGTALRRRRQTQMLIDRLLTNILEEAARLVSANRGAGGDPPRLRLALVDPSGPSRRPTAEFRVIASAGMEDQADDRLTLDPRNLGAPMAFAQRKPIFATVQGLSAQNLWMTKYEHALVWPDLCSMICIPVFGRPVPPGGQPPAPQRVLCLDSSDSLQGEFNDPTFMDGLTAMSLNLSRTLITEAIG